MNRIQELESLIKHHKALYYQGRPEINDVDYDKMEEELKSLDPSSSALEVVGSTLIGRKVKHDKKMLSLNKTYKIEELEKWIDGKEVVSTLKIDGVSCSIVYENGKLSLGKTRGDGTFGEEITEKLLWLETIPSSIKNTDKIEVRGELFCTEENFFKLSEEMVKISLDKPTSQRNIVAGLISRKENIELCRYIEFRAFDLIGENFKFNAESDKETYLENIGFTPEKFTLHKSKETISQEVDNARLFMSEGSYQIDGLVFTYNDYSIHEELGTTAHHPRYKIAFKYHGDTKQTKIKEIKWSISRNGILTPVAEVTPVELSGATISRVTLHNYGMVKQNNLKIGDTIEIIRSGEVIPKFLSVVKESKNSFDIPTNCPVCASKINIEDIRLLCVNEKCPGKNKESILNFIQKIGIDDLSSKRLEEMISKGLVEKIDDLYELKKGQLLDLEKFKDKLEEKVLNNINKSKDANLTIFLSALGIQGGAFNKCEKVVSAGFDNIEKIINLTMEDLLAIEGFAEKSSTEFLKSIKEKHKLIKTLVKKGFVFESVAEIGEGIFTGKKVAITGTLSDKRANIEAKIRGAGGAIVSSVSKKTDVLLTNQQTSSSSKFKKATDLGIQIISEDDLNNMILKD